MFKQINYDAPYGVEGVMTRRQKAGRWREPGFPVRRAAGPRHSAEMAWRHWAPRVLNAAEHSQRAMLTAGVAVEGCDDPPPAPLKRHGAATGGEEVWVDGGCKTVHDVEVAGWGVCYGIGHPGNTNGEVPGQQSPKRAELSGLVAAQEAEEGPLHIRTDCKEVLHAWEKLMQLRTRAWMKRPLLAQPVPNADLWRRAYSAQRRREERELKTTVTWVPRQSSVEMRTAHDLASAAITA